MQLFENILVPARAKNDSIFVCFVQHYDTNVRLIALGSSKAEQRIFIDKFEYLSLSYNRIPLAMIINRFLVHIRPEHFGDSYRTVGVLIKLHDRYQYSR